jgi:hypothetical protein
MLQLYRNKIKIFLMGIYWLISTHPRTPVIQISILLDECIKWPVTPSMLLVFVRNCCALVLILGYAHLVGLRTLGFYNTRGCPSRTLWPPQLATVQDYP